MDVLVLVLFLLNSFALIGSDVKIKGGLDAKIDEFPWAASIQPVPKTHKAGATILSKSYVLTACHVIPNGTFYVMAGSVKIKPGLFRSWTGQSRQVVETVRHPKCQLMTGVWAYDYAVLKVEKDFETGPNLKPILLTPDSYKYSDELNDLTTDSEVFCTATGWGIFKSPAEQSNVLKAVELKAVPTETCKEKLCKGHPEICKNNASLVLEHKVCTQSKDNNEKGACGKDEGGPLMCYGEVVAIISFVRDCGSNGTVSLHSKIINVAEWIKLVAPDVKVPPAPVTLPPPQAATSFSPILSLLMWFFIKII